MNANLKPNTLSEAILLGCEMRPIQCKNKLFVHTNQSCVIGAAVEGLTGVSLFTQPLDTLQNSMATLRRVFPILNRRTHCPECSNTESLWYILVHLNNDHRRTRECIAEWVRQEFETPVSIIESVCLDYQNA